MTGHVLLSVDDPLRRDVNALLLDTSKSGFRAAYEYPALVSGQLVAFEQVSARGHARVMWTRITDTNIESGFLVLSSASSS